MPIDLTWNQPSAGIIGYVLYRREGNGVLNRPEDFLSNLPSSPLAFRDFGYDKTVLQVQGYTYGISAIGPGGESDISVLQFIQVNFDQPLFSEDWNPNLPTPTEELLYNEQWEFVAVLTPNQLYSEPWEGIPTEPPVGFSYDERWEPKEVTDPGVLEHEELWEKKTVTDPGVLEYEEQWSIPNITNPGSLEYNEGWEVI